MLDDVEHVFDGGLEGDWPARAADVIVNVVGLVRDNTTGRITTIARGFVFGLFAAVIGTAVLVLVIIASIRLLDEVLPVRGLARLPRARPGRGHRRSTCLPQAEPARPARREYRPTLSR